MSIETLHFKTNLLSNQPFDFDEMAMSLFRLQSERCQIYKKFITHLGIDLRKVSTPMQIPFMPISFFKHHKISLSGENTAAVFESSGTTGNTTSKHYVTDLSFYLAIATQGFEAMYGALEDFCIIGLLPSYLERQNSSLVAMVSHFVQKSQHQASGFYLNNYQQLADVLNTLRGQKTLVIGVTFALLDFAEQHAIDLENITIMETGGMKGRRNEMTREEVHQELRNAFSVKHIHSEYGMTELLSQAYAPHSGIFSPISTMRVYARALDDPLSTSKTGRGGLNVIDLANCDTCAFIATEDQGVVLDHGDFEVLGRIDHSDTRGCNLMVH